MPERGPAGTLNDDAAAAPSHTQALPTASSIWCLPTAGQCGP